MNAPPRTQSVFERSVIQAMRVGMLLSAACLAAGLVLMLWSARTSVGEALMRAGLLILMGTPVLRVILSIAEAVRQREWFWLWSTVAVAVILTGTVIYSFRTL